MTAQEPYFLRHLLLQASHCSPLTAGIQFSILGISRLNGLSPSERNCLVDSLKGHVIISTTVEVELAILTVNVNGPKFSVLIQRKYRARASENYHDRDVQNIYE